LCALDEVTVPKDTKAQQCKGIGAATASAGGAVGGKITTMVNQLTGLGLPKETCFVKFQNVF
jgi:hypothetical protein